MRARLIIGENPVIATDALRVWLAAQPEFDVVAASAEPEWLAAHVRDLRAEIVLLDLNSLRPAAASFIRALKRTGTRVFVLCSATDRETISGVIAAGADGYASRLADRAELCAALERVARGGNFYGAEVAEAFVEPSAAAGAFDIVDPGGWELTSAFSAVAPSERTVELTSREVEILRLVATGHRSHAIASWLSISVPTVRKHRENLMKKLGLHNSAEVTAFAIRNGLFGSAEREI